jgi:glucose dehydrogenase
MRAKLSLGVLLLVVGASVTLLAAMQTQQPSACGAPAGADWPQVAANLGSQGYSSLTQIDKSNISRLAPAWVVHTNIEPVTQPAPGPGNTAVGQQTTPSSSTA